MWQGRPDQRFLWLVVLRKGWLPGQLRKARVMGWTMRRVSQSQRRLLQLTVLRRNVFHVCILRYPKNIFESVFGDFYD